MSTSFSTTPASFRSKTEPSTSCFEHNQMFWLAFTEMVRVVKPGGHVYINAPSNGTYHAYPYDNWRFYPDASLALVAWAKRQGMDVALIESFVARKKAVWNDCVMVFQRPIGGTTTPPERLLCDVFSDAFNIRTHESETVQNFSELPEDLLIARSLKEANAELEKTVKVGQRRSEAQERQIEAQRRQLEALRQQLEAARRDLSQSAATRRELDGALQTVERMKRSISWRLTKPLRLVIRAFRNTRQRLRG